MLANEQRSFTLMEIIVVIIITSVIAGVAIPQLNKTMQRTVERDAVIRLEGIRSHLEVYKAKHGEYPPGTMDEINEINTALGTNLTDTDKLTFSCPNEYNPVECRAESTEGWSVHIESNYLIGGQAFVPHCLSDWLGGDPCPTCDQDGCY